jgi:hypothetical protein
MDHEQDFYRTITAIPDLPSDLFGQIDRRIRQRSLLNRSLIALAASVIICIGLLALPVTQHTTTATVLHSDIVTELQNINDYLNATDLEEDLVLYSDNEEY